MKLRYILFSIFLLIFAVSLIADDTTYVYAKQLNHFYSFGGNIRSFHSLKNLDIAAEISNNSSVYSETSRLKTLSNLKISLLYKLSDAVRIGPAGNYYSLRDGQTYNAYDYDKSKIGILGKYISNDYTASLQTGYSGERRLGIYDSGWHTNAEIYRQHNDSFFDPHLDWEFSQHGQRQNYTLNNRVSLGFEPESRLKNNFIAGFKLYHRDYYINTGGDTEERLNTSAYFANKLIYPLSDHVRLRHVIRFDLLRDGLNFAFNEEEVKRKRDQLLLNNDIRLSGRFKNISAYTGFTNQYEQTRTSADNPNLILPADYIFDKKNVVSGISWRLSDRDSVSIDYLGSLLYYDTPDSNNYDDRDELTYSITPKWTHQLAPYTRISVSFNSYLHHYVYLFHQRSARNHWNRIFTLKSRLSLNVPDKITWVSSHDIYSNYFVYDYGDSSFIHVQSMVFRGFRLRENLRINLSKKTFLKIIAYFRWEDNGILDWDDWIQEITDSKYIIKLECMPGFRHKYLSLSAGPVFSRRRDFRYESNFERTPGYYSDRLGAAFNMIWGNSLYLTYRLERIDQTNRAIVYNQSGNLRWTFVF